MENLSLWHNVHSMDFHYLRYRTFAIFLPLFAVMPVAASAMNETAAFYSGQKNLIGTSNALQRVTRSELQARQNPLTDPQTSHAFSYVIQYGLAEGSPRYEVGKQAAIADVITPFWQAYYPEQNDALWRDKGEWAADPDTFRQHSPRAPPKSI